MNTCDSCKWGKKAYEALKLDSTIVCCRYPPTLHLYYADTEHGKERTMESNFPRVLPNWTCGEYSNRNGLIG